MLGFDEGIKMGPNDDKVLGTLLINIDGITLGVILEQTWAL